ncbi:hypothetical protein [uncultured Croceitalea sp.]|uniref:hypothetical protein n=1 Tax=uncultured Croceitalea sp. TaxID=1798908 RepID=UPI003305944A
MNVIQKRDIEKAQESIVTAINPSKRIKDLEKRLKFSETFENKVALADAYLDEKMFNEAIEHYQGSLKDVFKNDFYVLTKLQEAYYYTSKFKASIATAERIIDNPSFKKSRSSFLYGMALEKNGDLKKAEVFLRNFDAPYNYFMERLELARFLVRIYKIEDGKGVYQEMVNESENMSKQNLRNNRHLIKKAKEELNQLS